MNKSQILLKLVLQEVKVPFDMENFDNRLLLQKTVYLIQQAGVELGYPYNWHIRGPYSPMLADDLFFLAGVNEQGLSNYRLGDKTLEVIKKVKNIFSDQSRDLNERAKKLELLASVLFLVKTGQAEATQHDELSNILKANNKPFEPSDVKKAVELLKEHAYSI